MAHVNYYLIRFWSCCWSPIDPKESRSFKKNASSQEDTFVCQLMFLEPVPVPGTSDASEHKFTLEFQSARVRPLLDGRQTDQDGLATINPSRVRFSVHARSLLGRLHRLVAFSFPKLESETAKINSPLTTFSSNRRLLRS